MKTDLLTYLYQPEWKQLHSAIANSRHVVVLPPSSYLSTSLLIQESTTKGVVHGQVNLLVARRSDLILEAFFNGVGELLADLLPKSRSAQQKYLKWFKSLRPEWLENNGRKYLYFFPIEQRLPEVMLSELLIGLDRLAQDNRKKLVMHVSYVESLFSLNDHRVLASSFLEALQKSKALTFILSGMRGPLTKALSDLKTAALATMQSIQFKRPSVQLCERALSGVLPKKSGSTIDTIIKLSNTHPFYLQHLTEKVASQPTVDLVAYWQHYCKREWLKLEPLVAGLSNNQAVLLNALANTPTHQPSSKHFLTPLKMTQASLYQAFQSLQFQDWVYQDEVGFWQVADPIIKAFLG